MEFCSIPPIYILVCFRVHERGPVCIILSINCRPPPDFLPEYMGRARSPDKVTTDRMGQAHRVNGPLPILTDHYRPFCLKHLLERDVVL